jgi:hypothetical protein
MTTVAGGNTGAASKKPVSNAGKFIGVVKVSYSLKLG